MRAGNPQLCRNYCKGMAAKAINNMVLSNAKIHAHAGAVWLHGESV